MREMLLIVSAGYIFGLSLLGFTIMGVDKSRAKRGEWRIRERTLLLIALFGGGIGSYFGMRWFRHKLKNLKFCILLPVSALGYAVIIILLWQKA